MARSRKGSGGAPIPRSPTSISPIAMGRGGGSAGAGAGAGVGSTEQVTQRADASEVETALAAARTPVKVRMQKPKPPPGFGDSVMWPDSTASWASYLSFHWVDGLVRLGNQRPLYLTDLWRQPPTDCSAHLLTRFLKLWEENRRAPGSGGTARLWPVLLRFMGWRYVGACGHVTGASACTAVAACLTARLAGDSCSYVGVGVIRLISESCTLVGPMVLHGLVDTVHNWDEESGSMLHVFGLGFLLYVTPLP